MSGLTWNGDAIARRVQRASVEAIDETTGGAVTVAQQLVHVDSHDLQKSLGAVPAEVRGDEVVGAFGSLEDPGYAIEQEFDPEPRGKPYMRPAALQEFPKLASRIARRLGQ